MWSPPVSPPSTEKVTRNADRCGLACGRWFPMHKPVLSLALAALALGGAHAGEVVHLAIGEWPPFTSEHDHSSKLLERVVQEAFKLEGLQVQFSYFPWKRSYTMAEEGLADGTFPWNKVLDRERSFHFHRTPLLTDENVFFHPRSLAFDWNSLDDLKKYRVGATLGYRNERIYKDKGIAFDLAPSEELNFKKMAAGRIDVYETSKVVGYSTIARTLTTDEAKLITHHPRPLERSNYYVLFSRKTAHGQRFSEKFESGLQRLKSSGAYDKLLAQDARP